MSTNWSFCRLALASTMALAACSSDMPTSPTAASQALAVAAPTISLSTTSLLRCYPGHFYYDWPSHFRYWCGSSAYLSIVNAGGGTLNWTSTKSASWIKRSQTTGTAPSVITISVDGTGLPPGIYQGWIKVWASGATNSPQKVNVTMTRY